MNIEALKKHIYVICSLLWILFCLQGCQTPTYLVKDGKAIRTNANLEKDYAIVKCDGGSDGISIRLISVDDHIFPKDNHQDYSNMWNFAFRLKFSQGKHTLHFSQVEYHSTLYTLGFSDMYSSFGRRDLDIDVENGHVYEVKTKMGVDKKNPVVIWLEDISKTKE